MPSDMRGILTEARDEIWLFLRKEQPKIVKLQSDRFFQDLEQALELFNFNLPDIARNQNKIVSIKNYGGEQKDLQPKSARAQPEYVDLLKIRRLHSSDCQQSIIDDEALPLMNTYIGSRTPRRSPDAILKLIDDFARAWEKATDNKPRRISGHKTPFVEAAKIFLSVAGISRPELFLRQFLTKLESQSTFENL